MNFNSLNIGSNESFDPSKSLCIEASAGTGKTYTIQQIVARLINDGTPLNKILIVTYTEKAAGELKDRIRKKIEEVIDSRKLNKDNKTDAEFNNVKDLSLFTEALREVDNAPIFTIHSFCQKTLRENAYDAGRPFDMAMIDEGLVEDIIAEWARDNWLKDDLYKILLENGSSASSLINDLKKLLSNAINTYKGNDANGKEIIELNSVDTYGFDSMPKNFQDLLENADVKSNLEILKSNADLFFTKKKDAQTIGDFVSALENWAGGALYDGTKFKDGATPKNWDSEAYSAFKFFYNLKAFLGKSLLNCLKNKFLYEQTPKLFEKWQAYKDSHKCQSYNDMILSVHQAILEKNSQGHDSLLCEKLRKEYRFAIIDEFQDTNQLQWDIFKKLFNPIFVVGDPKQSIYSFQGADVNVYQKATDYIKSVGVKNDLVYNFRSTESIIKGCNHLFEAVEEDGKKKDFFYANDGETPNEKCISFTESHFPEGATKAEPTLNGEHQLPFLIPSEEIEEESFAQAAVEKIVEFCTFKNFNGEMKTALQVFDKDNPSTLRDVTFKDFAVLARTRSEMEIIEESMRNAGIPFTRYKDNNLFNGRECAEWIALFKAIEANDFTAKNRKILSEALITDFFRVKLTDVEKDLFDDPMNTVRQRIAEWKILAKKRRFAELQEKIYEHTQIEKHLMDLSMLQNLAKLRQIGNYSISYLYQNNASISDVIRHLEGLRKDDSDTDDEDGNLVAKGTDFDAVQVMTIHASKGLEFPVVISVAGFKQFNSSASGPFIFHKNDSTKMGFGSEEKDIRKAEEIEEWKRLFYVDFTRASSVLIMPRYSTWRVKDSDAYKPEFEFLGRAFNNLCEKHADFIDKLTKCDWSENRPAELRKIVKGQILKPLSDKKNKLIDNGSQAQQETAANELQKKIPHLSIFQFSYSTLSGKADDPINANDKGRTNKDDGNDASEFTVTTSLIKYPKGSKLGNALHSIFENLNFYEFAKDVKNLEFAKIHEPLIQMIDKEFKTQGLPIWKHQKEWTDYTVEIVWNTLHAKLPTVNAGNILHDAVNQFELANIQSNKILKECQFNVNATLEECGIESEHLGCMFKGFMDVVFVRGERYSILDWKSDVLENNIYNDAAIQKKVDEEYSIQRVLYSYCLVKWLKQFYPEKSENEIFENHFGGIYYVFLRGTRENCSSGIYSHTWKSFDDLQNAFDKIKKLMTKKKAEFSGDDYE